MGECRVGVGVRSELLFVVVVEGLVMVWLWVGMGETEGFRVRVGLVMYPARSLLRMPKFCKTSHSSAPRIHAVRPGSAYGIVHPIADFEG